MTAEEREELAGVLANLEDPNDQSSVGLSNVLKEFNEDIDTSNVRRAAIIALNFNYLDLDTISSYDKIRNVFYAELEAIGISRGTFDEVRTGSNSLISIKSDEPQKAEIVKAYGALVDSVSETLKLAALGRHVSAKEALAEDKSGTSLVRDIAAGKLENRDDAYVTGLQLGVLDYTNLVNAFAWRKNVSFIEEPTPHI